MHPHTIKTQAHRLSTAALRAQSERLSQHACAPSQPGLVPEPEMAKNRRLEMNIACERAESLGSHVCEPGGGDR
jgi:hypothetical protein